MAEAALKLMEVEDFLVWDGKPSLLYQLRDGIPVAMPISASAHGTLLANIVGTLGNALDARPEWRVQVEAGIVPMNRRRFFHVADAAVSCTPTQPREQRVLDPILIVEVLSESTAHDDRLLKVPDYRLMQSMQEILLLDSRTVLAEVHRRESDRWVVHQLRRPDELLQLSSVGLETPLSALYRNVAL